MSKMSKNVGGLHYSKAPPAHSAGPILVVVVVVVVVAVAVAVAV